MIERKKKILKATAASSLLILIIEPYDSNDAGKLWVRRRAGGYKKNKKRGRPRTRRITNTGSEFQDGGRVKKRSANARGGGRNGTVDARADLAALGEFDAM